MTPQQFQAAALERANRVLVGVDEPFSLLLAALVVGGNVLIEGVPGTAKTLMARLLAHVLVGGGPGPNGSAERGRFQRIQFTPDLMPSDIVGTTVYNAASGAFTFQPGPVFANVVVADEINRAPARTQSALLEAMEEQHVTVDGERMPLPRVFLVVATQNPVEFEGTYPLPEAQLDRFLFKVLVGHGSPEAERDIILRHHRGLDIIDLAAAGVEPVADAADVLEVRAQVAAVRVDTSVAEYLVAVGRATREAHDAQYGASVRGAIALLHASKAHAAFAGRDYVTPDDVKAVAVPALRHRLVLKPEAELDGIQPDDVIARILATVPVPR